MERLTRREKKVEEYEKIIHDLMLDTIDQKSLLQKQQNEQYQVSVLWALIIWIEMIGNSLGIAFLRIKHLFQHFQQKTKCQHWDCLRPVSTSAGSGERASEDKRLQHHCEAKTHKANAWTWGTKIQPDPHEEQGSQVGLTWLFSLNLVRNFISQLICYNNWM